MCFSPILYYANLAPANGEDLLEMAQSFRSTGHEHLMLQINNVLFTSIVDRFST
jgi:hypothetical protein